MSARVKTPTCSLPKCGAEAAWRVTLDEGEPTQISLNVCRIHGQRIRTAHAKYPDLAVQVPGMGRVEMFGPRDRIELLTGSDDA